MNPGITSLVLASAVCAGTALADDFRYDPPIDFQLRLLNQTLDLDYGAGTEVDTRVKRASLYWRERYSERVQLGLIVGHSRLTQTNHAATAGLEPEGYHAGLSLEVDLYRSTRALVTLGAGYLYQSVKHEDAGQTVELSWDEPSTQFGVALRLSGDLWAYGAARHGSIDGEERRNGAVNQTLAVERAAETGSLLGLEIQLDEDGYIGIVAESGFNESVAVYFGRRY